MITSGGAAAQITIGKTTPSNSPANATVSLEFGNATGGVRGIVLPWVTSQDAATTTGTLPGTLIFDSATQKIKYSIGAGVNATSVSDWVDLSNGALTPLTPSVPDADVEQANAKALVGGVPTSNTTPGILVLGDTNRAMILPRVASHTSIVAPSAGMMVYVTTTNQLAFFNGREWSFWSKP